MTSDLAALTHHDALPDGTRVLVRPLTPEDARLYPDFLAHVTAEDMRLRFFAAVRELSDQRIFDLTHVDYTRAMAFIAIDQATGQMLGVVRLHLDDDRKAGEFAVIVRSELKGHGLGWLLMRRMIATRARSGSHACTARCWPKTAPCCACVPSSASAPRTIRRRRGSRW